MKAIIQRWLGITEILSTLESIEERIKRHKTVDQDLLRPLLNGVGRIIAKHDAAFVDRYDDSKVRAASDKLGEEAIARLRAEDKARRHTTGEL